MVDLFAEDAFSSTPREFGKLIADDIDKGAGVIKSANIAPL